MRPDDRIAATRNCASPFGIAESLYEEEKRAELTATPSTH
jgi:hypothetical protein